MVIRELGYKVDPERDTIAVDGRNIPREVRHLYVLLNKPRGCVTTRHDPHATDTVMDLVLPALYERFGKGDPAVAGLHPVGRLDAQSEGLLILTNDGDFTQALTHPRHQVPKRYEAEVRGIPDREAIERLRTGVPLFGQRTLPARVRLVRADRTRNIARVEVELREGRNQQVRRMLQAVGYPVNRLTRTSIGPITLSRLRPGHWRFLTPGEVKLLRERAAPPPEEELAVAPRPRPGGKRGARPAGSRSVSRPAKTDAPSGVSRGTAPRAGNARSGAAAARARGGAARKR